MKIALIVIMAIILAVYIAAVWVEAKENKEVKKKVEEFEKTIANMENLNISRGGTLMELYLKDCELEKRIEKLERKKTSTKK